MSVLLKADRLTFTCFFEFKLQAIILRMLFFNWLNFSLTELTFH